MQLQIVEFATGSMTRPEKLVVRLTDISGPEERGKVDEISAHACINDMSVVRSPGPNASAAGDREHAHTHTHTHIVSEALSCPGVCATQPDYRTGSGSNGSVTAEELKGLLLSTVELSR